MFLELTKENWNNLHYKIQEDQKDYDYIDKDDLLIYIYGYPFDVKTETWISSLDIYRSYKKDRFSFIEHIDGLYCILILDKDKNECNIIMDRYGVYSLFYLKNESQILISDNISEIVQNMSIIKLNSQSIIEYLNFGQKIGRKTHIEKINEFQYGRIYHINKDLVISEKIYWQYIQRFKEETLTDEQYKRIFNRHVHTAMNLEKKNIITTHWRFRYSNYFFCMYTRKK
ncbi:MAG: hypothetical protein ACFFG0_53335 [Candidatus Thorarchaeota archaeon]